MALVCLCRGNFYWPPHTTILFCSIFLDKIVLDTLKSRYHRSAPLGIETDIPFTLSKTLDLAKQDFEDNKKVISNLKKQRNTLWAHHDKRYILDPSQIEDSYPIKWQEIEHLLQFASDFTNSVISNFSSSIELPFFNNADACFDNVQTVLSLMENGMNKRSNTNG